MRQGTMPDRNGCVNIAVGAPAHIKYNMRCAASPLAGALKLLLDERVSGAPAIAYRPRRRFVCLDAESTRGCINFRLPR
jgi:hypothetical protein